MFLMSDVKVRLPDGQLSALSDIRDQREILSIGKFDDLLPALAHCQRSESSSTASVTLQFTDGYSFQCAPDTVIMLRDKTGKSVIDLTEQDILLSIFLAGEECRTAYDGDYEWKRMSSKNIEEKASASKPAYKLMVDSMTGNLILENGIVLCDANN